MSPSRGARPGCHSCERGLLPLRRIVAVKATRTQCRPLAYRLLCSLSEAEVEAPANDNNEPRKQRKGPSGSELPKKWSRLYYWQVRIFNAWGSFVTQTQRRFLIWLERNKRIAYTTFSIGAVSAFVLCRISGRL